jgi:hypothetical protein
MAPFAYNLNALKLMLVMTPPIAGPLGLMHLLRPNLLVTLLGAPARKSPYLYSDAFMGSVFLAFASTALIGLFSGDPGSFFPLIMLQFFYKVYHLLAFLGTSAPMNMHNLIYVVVWLGYIVGDVVVFAAGRRAPKGKQT